MTADAGGFRTEDPPADQPTSSDVPMAARSTDECGDGLDGDGDGEIDESCSCVLGTSQPCWVGREVDRGVGECRDGMQRCVDSGEFGAVWGACVGAINTGNCAGEDVCAPREFGESCQDGSDDDCDGFSDCEDPDCRGNVACAPSMPPPDPQCASREMQCNDGADDDCDGHVDEDDSDCMGRMVCADVEMFCNNDRDDDCDGDVDDADSDCRGSQRCAASESDCHDGIDNDCDGDVDGDDDDCAAATCLTAESLCSDGLDDDCDGLIDAADPDCQPPVVCNDSEQSCNDRMDDDCDGRPDATDPDCAVCSGRETEVCDRENPSSCRSSAIACADGIDGDCDGLMDCQDPDCADSIQCFEAPNPRQQGCRCIPGSTRDCHVFRTCSWGNQTCKADGTWDWCMALPGVAMAQAELNQLRTDYPDACGDTSGTAYDAACCVAAGRCCDNQDFDYSLYDSSQPRHASVGNCGNVCQ